MIPSEITPIFIITQTLGALAAATFISSFQMKKRAWILIFGGIARVLFTIQYILLGQYVPAAFDILGVFAVMIAGRKHHPALKKWLLPLITLVHLTILAITIVFYKSWTDIVVFVGMTLHTAALWFSSEKLIRRLSLAGTPCWFTCNIVNGAYFPALSDVFSGISIIVAMFRYDFKKKKAEESEQAEQAQ